MRGKSDDEILNLALDLLLEKRAPERRHARRVAAEQRKVKQRNVTKETEAKTKETGDAKVPCAHKDAEVPAAENSTTRRRRQAPLGDRDRANVEAGRQCSFVAGDGHRCQARYLVTSGLTFSGDDFQVSCIAALGQGFGRTTTFSGTDETKSADASLRRWQIGLAISNWR